MTGHFASEDIARAVERGVLDQATADRFKAFLATSAAGTSSDNEDEQLRLVSGFGDIFVAIGIVLFLGALAFLLMDATKLIPSAAVALASWGLSELFTRIRRQALPSILLLASFAGSVFSLAANGVDLLQPGAVSSADNAAIAVGGLATCAAVAFHWWRFRVPVTIAAACAAATAMIVGLLESLIPNSMFGFGGLLFLPIGVAIFALAMRFDSADRARRTRRTDIAFWLHALAAPMVVHPVMQNIMQGETTGTMAAILTLLVFAVLSFVALTVDRRAMLVSSLLYLGYAIYSVLSAGEALPSTSFVVLLVGAVVLGLSLAWRPLRAALLKRLPLAITNRVPLPHPPTSVVR